MKGAQVIDLLMCPNTISLRDIAFFKNTITSLGQIFLRNTALAALFTAVILGSATALGFLWLPLAPLPFVGTNKAWRHASFARHAWRARKRALARLSLFPAQQVAEADVIAAAGTDLPDLPGSGRAILLSVKDCEPALLPAQQAAHARLEIETYAVSPEGVQLLADIEKRLIAKFPERSMLFLVRDSESLFLFAPNTKEEVSLLALRQISPIP